MRPLESFVGQPIRSLQTMLRVIANDQGYDLSVIPDGIYGKQTMAAVSEFQRRSGLPVTGTADRQTWETIVSSYTPARTRQGEAQPIAAIFEPGEVIRKGEFHPNVYLAQGMLIIMSESYPGISMPGMTGYIDIPTSASLESFQLFSQLPATGELDRETWKNLALHYPQAASRHPQRKKQEF